MKVGVIIGRLSPEEGGGHSFRMSLIQAMRMTSSSHTFTILDPWSLDHQDHVTGSIAETSAIGREGPFRLEQRIRETDIDIAWFLTPAHAPIDIPYITTVWDLQHRLQPFFPEVSTVGWKWEDRERSYRRTLPRAARIITGTHVGKDEVVRFYGVAPENVRVVRLPSPLTADAGEHDACTKVRGTYGIEREYILYPAHFWAHKNHVNLLLALDVLRRNEGLDLDLVLAGADRGNREHVAETAARLGLKSRVHMVGFVPREDLEALYQQALALVYPSFFGPDNLPPLEAFAFGCPVAAARVLGAEEQLEDAALLFDPTDPRDISYAIKALHDDASLRSRLTKKGLKLAACRTPKHYVAHICSVLDDFENAAAVLGTYAHRSTALRNGTGNSVHRWRPGRSSAVVRLVGAGRLWHLVGRACRRAVDLP